MMTGEYTPLVTFLLMEFIFFLWYLFFHIVHWLTFSRKGPYTPNIHTCTLFTVCTYTLSFKNPSIQIYTN